MIENCIIRIDGVQVQDGEKNTVSLYTKGSFVRKDGKYFIRYNETEATGYDGCVTTVKIENEQKVSMLRHGKNPSQLIIEKGRRHLCHYDTGAGPLLLGVSTESIVNRLAKNGGEVDFTYTLDVNSVDMSTNSVKITVREVI